MKCSRVPANGNTCSEGLPGVLGNKGTLAKYRREQGNISQFLGTGNKIRKITVRKHSENVWEHGNIGQFWKGTREHGPPWETLCSEAPLLHDQSFP